MPRLMAWLARVCRSRCGGGEQAHQFGVQRHIAVFADLAQRNAQPVPGADPHYRIRVQIGQLTGPHPGPGKQLDHEPVARVGAGPGGGHQPGGVRVVEELRQWPCRRLADMHRALAEAANPADVPLAV
jgi:hypothetical protein